MVAIGFGLLLAAAGALAPARAAPPATDLFLREADDVIDVRWSLPAEAALEPALVRLLRNAADDTRALQRKEAAEAHADAKTDGFRFSPYEWVQHWKLEALSDRLIVLRASVYSFTGGAHGNIGETALLFDRATDRPLALKDLFLDWPKAEALLTPKLCAGVAEVRREKRGDGAEPSAIAAFDSCPPLADLAVAPFGEGSRPWGFNWAAAPYVAGPWSEGSYAGYVSAGDVVELIKPEYREPFRLPERFR
jgi:hypothetical protein